MKLAISHQDTSPETLSWRVTTSMAHAAKPRRIAASRLAVSGSRPLMAPTAKLMSGDRENTSASSGVGTWRANVRLRLKGTFISMAQMRL